MQHKPLCGRSAQRIQFLRIELRAQGDGAHDLGVAPGEEGRAVEGREKIGLAVELAHLVQRAVVGADAPVDDVAPDDLKGGRGGFRGWDMFRCASGTGFARPPRAPRMLRIGGRGSALGSRKCSFA
jgi:hypothetical protein